MNIHPDFEEILIVPLDYAKTNHTVQFCFATGEHLLNNALTVYNDSRGAAYLLDRIGKAKQILDVIILVPAVAVDKTRWNNNALTGANGKLVLGRIPEFSAAFYQVRDGIILEVAHWHPLNWPLNGFGCESARGGGTPHSRGCYS